VAGKFCCCATNARSGNCPAGAWSWEKPHRSVWPGKSPRRPAGWSRPGRSSTRGCITIDQVERNVFIVTYGCHLTVGQDDVEPVLSHEHKQIGLFTEGEVADLVMPQGYKTSIATWYSYLRSGQGQQAPA
jgi:hypothetical protein